MTRRLVAPLLTALVLAIAPEPADAVGPVGRDAVFGCWLAENGDSVLHIRSEGKSLIGEIAALEDAKYGAGEFEGRDGQPRKDDDNPDPKKRARPLLGLNLLLGFAYEDGWKGEIYDPGSGSTYSATMQVDPDGRLELHGYVGFSWLGRTVYYVDPAANPDTRDRLFSVSDATGPRSSAEGAG